MAKSFFEGFAKGFLGAASTDAAETRKLDNEKDMAYYKAVTEGNIQLETQTKLEKIRSEQALEKLRLEKKLEGEERMKMIAALRPDIASQMEGIQGAATATPITSQMQGALGASVADDTPLEPSVFGDTQATAPIAAAPVTQELPAPTPVAQGISPQADAQMIKHIIVGDVKGAVDVQDKELQMQQSQKNALETEAYKAQLAKTAKDEERSKLKTNRVAAIKGSNAPLIPELVDYAIDTGDRPNPVLQSLNSEKMMQDYVIAKQTVPELANFVTVNANVPTGGLSGLGVVKAISNFTSSDYQRLEAITGGLTLESARMLAPVSDTDRSFIGSTMPNSSYFPDTNFAIATQKMVKALNYAEYHDFATTMAASYGSISQGKIDEMWKKYSELNPWMNKTGKDSFEPNANRLPWQTFFKNYNVAMEKGLSPEEYYSKYSAAVKKISGSK